jgi:hypothetical protein
LITGSLTLDRVLPPVVGLTMSIGPNDGVYLRKEDTNNGRLLSVVVSATVLK